MTVEHEHSPKESTQLLVRQNMTFEDLALGDDNGLFLTFHRQNKMSDKSPLKIIIGCNHQFALFFSSWLRTVKYCNVANTPTHSYTHSPIHTQRTLGQSPLTWSYCRYRAATQFQARRVPCLAALLLFCDI